MAPHHCGVEAARSQLADLLERAHGGATTIITRHGKPYAALTPIEVGTAKGPSVSLLALKGSGSGLWGTTMGQHVANMRDEWE